MKHKKSKYDGVFSQGHKFGEWIVLDEKVHHEREARITCKCSCGDTHKVSAYNLLSGMSTRCGECRRKDSTTLTGNKNPSWKGIGNIPAGKYRHIKDENDRKILAESWDKSNKKCSLTGWNISIQDGTASPDRIDSNKGYTLGNIQWVHINVNIAKNLFDLDHFVTLCHAVSTKHKNPNKIYSDNKFGLTTKGK